MQVKIFITLAVSMTITGLSASEAFAKKIFPAEIMARDLNYPGLGWLGHVGIATANMMDPGGMNQNASQVIEILNESVVGQIK